MKRKKLLSTVVAGMLVAAQMVVPVAADSGAVDVDVTTKMGIVRVVVPTAFVIAVDQFEMGASGSQIHSGDFTIKNQSELDVKVSVTSTVTAKEGVTFAEKRADVASATGASGTVWLAVAASKDGSKYQAASSGTDNLGLLNEKSVNVTTFVKGESATTATQTFYLAKGQANTAAYKSLVPSGAKSVEGVSYAQFYALTEIKSSGTAKVTSKETLQTEVNAGDVYVMVTSEASANNKTVTKISKGAVIPNSGGNAYDANNSYFTAAASPTAINDLTQGTLYVYGEMTAATTGADAAFRYIGALSSNSEKDTWDSGASGDISKIKIAYTITGLPASTYSAAKTAGDITYGYYKKSPTANYLKTGGKFYLSVDGINGFAAKPSAISVDSADLVAAKWSFDQGNGWVTLTEEPASGKLIVVTVDGVGYKVTTP